MPVYNWSALSAEDYRWLRERARRSADLFDGYRIDHLVGFYRTYGRARDGGEGFFTPSEEPAQRALGETVLDLFRGAGAEVIAEDLGTVPDFVRASLARLAIPGFRVLTGDLSLPPSPPPLCIVSLGSILSSSFFGAGGGAAAGAELAATSAFVSLDFSSAWRALSASLLAARVSGVGLLSSARLLSCG